MKSKNEIQWHPAFIVALQALLIDYSDVLEYKLEHPLTTGPLRIDILVIKKRSDAVIKRQIAEIFRLDNIVEYKSPTDSLSINEFHKAFARANLYKALEDVDITGMTLSFVVAKRPRELFRYLRDTHGYMLDERHPGVFVVTGSMMPIQIIDISKLSDDENLWLQTLNRNLSGERLRRVMQMEPKYGKMIDLDAYLQVVLAANQEKLNKEDFSMWTARTVKIFEELGWTEKWRQKGELKGRQEGELKGRQEGELKGRQEGRKEGKLEAARAMFAEGDSFDKIARVTGISQRTLKAKLSRK